MLIDAGTKPGDKSVYHLWKAFDMNSNVGGAAGEISVMKGKLWTGLLNPLVAAQNFGEWARAWWSLPEGRADVLLVTRAEYKISSTLPRAALSASVADTYFPRLDQIFSTSLSSPSAATSPSSPAPSPPTACAPCRTTS